jgi:hypothetical protein
MAITLAEASKLAINGGNAFLSGVISSFAVNSEILRAFQFENIAGSAVQFNKEENLPGSAFRGVNEGYVEGTGTVAPGLEALYIAGGDLDVDAFIVKTQGQQARATQEAMQIKSIALNIEKVLFKGDHAGNPKEFDGLQKRLASGNQLIANGATAGGDALSLLKIDELLDAVIGCNSMFMSKAVRRLLTAASRDMTVGGDLDWTVDTWGRRIAKYGDCPIYVVNYDSGKNAILPFTEASPGGGAAASTSIYGANVGEGGLLGIQSGPISARDLGEQDAKPCYRTRVEWYLGLAAFSDTAIGRLNGIKNAAVVK